MEKQKRKPYEGLWQSIVSVFVASYVVLGFLWFLSTHVDSKHKDPGMHEVFPALMGTTTMETTTYGTEDVYFVPFNDGKVATGYGEVEIANIGIWLVDNNLLFNSIASYPYARPGDQVGFSGLDGFLFFDSYSYQYWDASAVLRDFGLDKRTGANWGIEIRNIQVDDDTLCLSVDNQVQVLPPANLDGPYNGRPEERVTTPILQTYCFSALS